MMCSVLSWSLRPTGLLDQSLVNLWIKQVQTRVQHLTMIESSVDSLLEGHRSLVYLVVDFAGQAHLVQEVERMSAELEKL